MHRPVTAGASNAGVPVYFALPPPFTWRSVGDVSVSARGDAAHLDDLLADAETRARRLGAEALIVRDMHTDAGYTQQILWESCSPVGMYGMGYGGMCPTTVNVLTVVSRLEATAIVRETRAVTQSPWGTPPPLGAAGGTDLPETLLGPSPLDLDGFPPSL